MEKNETRRRHFCPICKKEYVCGEACEVDKRVSVCAYCSELEMVFKREELAEISEKMGDAVHEAWMEKRKKEKGWHSPDDCPVKNTARERFGVTAEKDPMKGVDIATCPQCHTCMRPYKDLPESEKELDRQYPFAFFKILYEMGFNIIRAEREDH